MVARPGCQVWLASVDLVDACIINDNPPKNDAKISSFVMRFFERGYMDIVRYFFASVAEKKQQETPLEASQSRPDFLIFRK